jgi:hypothetical protein
MSIISLRRIQEYASENPETRPKLVSIVDAFEYVDDQQDLSLLTRLLNRMMLSPGLASAVCSLGAGYEQALDALTPDQVPAYNRTVKSVGRIAYKNRDLIDVLRSHVAADEARDATVESLVRIAGMDRTECAAENNRFRKYKCDVPKDVGVEQCGLNTNFTCEKGVLSGASNCDVGPGNRCRLSDIGRENKERANGRRRVKEITNAARLAYLSGI